MLASDAHGAIGFDPQTSGGLLAAVSSSVAAELAEVGFVEIGEAVPLAADSVHVRLR